VRRRLKDFSDLSEEPKRLRVYDPADWPDPECHPECAFWAAREEWGKEHPFDLDGPGHLSVVAEGPDVPWHPEWV
jgi:hypothetical protein